MANGIVIGGSDVRLGEVYANQIAQARAQANQQRAAEQQMMIERMRMAQAQRNADAENQYRYAALNQAASEKQADREFQRQEAMAGRGFSREENQAQRDFSGGQTDKQIGASKESQQSSQEFSREQAKLARDQQAQLQREHMDLQKEQMALQEKLQDKSLSQAERMEGSRRLRELFRFGEELKFKKDEAKQRAEEHEQRLELNKQQIGINKINADSMGEQRNAIAEERARKSDPALRYKDDYKANSQLAEKTVSNYLKRLESTNPAELKKWTHEEQQKAIMAQTEALMRGMGYNSQAGMGRAGGQANPQAAVLGVGPQAAMPNKANTFIDAFAGTDVRNNPTASQNPALRALSAGLSVPLDYGNRFAQWTNENIFGGAPMAPNRQRTFDAWAQDPLNPQTVKGLMFPPVRDVDLEKKRAMEQMARFNAQPMASPMAAPLMTPAYSLPEEF